MTNILNVSEQEIEWMIEGLDALILPDKAKRIKRELSRALMQRRRSLREIEDQSDD